MSLSFSPFQYPRRIECGWWVLVFDADTRGPRLSVSSADRVWVVVAVEGQRAVLICLSVSSADRVWVVGRPPRPPVLNPDLSVSSADRVWVVVIDVSSSSTIYVLSVSSADRVWVVGVQKDDRRHPVGNFQYPRRIECGWWLT